MLFDNDPDPYAFTVELYGQTRQLRAPGFFTFMLLLLVVNIAVLLPFPLSLIVRATLAVADAGYAAYLLMLAAWKFLSVTAAQSPSRRRRQRHTSSAKSGRGQQFPKMHILAGTFGAVCMRAEQSRRLDSDSSRTPSPQLQMDKTQVQMDKTQQPLPCKPAARWISTPTDQLTPQSSPNLSSNSLIGMFDDDDEGGEGGLEAPIGTHL